MIPASDPKRGKKSQGYALRIKVKHSETAIELVTVEHVSILEDLWHDYLFFKEQAQKTVGFEHKRYLRVSLLVFMAYLEGVVNHWCHNLFAEKGWSEKKIRAFIFEKKVHEKITALTNYVAKKNPSVREPIIDAAKRLRNKLSHFQVGKDIEVFDSLTHALLTDTDQSVDEWLSVAEAALGEKRHPNTQGLAKLILDTNPDAKADCSAKWSG